MLRIPFSLFNATQILCIAYLPFCSPDRSAIPATTETVESRFIIESIKKRVQNFAYHQKSISGTAGNKSPKSGQSRNVREISTLPPKPRVERSSRSVPAIDWKSVDAGKQGVYGLLLLWKMSFHGSEIGDNKPLKRLKSVPFLTVIASKEHQFFIGNPLVNPRSQSANSALTWPLNHLGG